jgi:hypothetical protein
MPRKPLTGWFGKSRTPKGVSLGVGVFGKHPGWEDHIRPSQRAADPALERARLGFDQALIAKIRDQVYEKGIDHCVRTHAWKTASEVEEGQRSTAPLKRHVLEGFAHVLLWEDEADVVLGRLWSSRDGTSQGGRRDFPMGCCVQATGIGVGTLVAEVGEQLAALETKLKAAGDGEGVMVTLDAARGMLRGLAERLGKGTAGSASGLSVPGADAARVALLRALYSLDAQLGLWDEDGVGTGVGQVRLPMMGLKSEAALEWWHAALRALVPGEEPVLLAARHDETFVDAWVGAWGKEDFAALRLSKERLAPVNEVAFSIGAPFAERVGNQVDAWLGSLLQPSAAAPGTNSAPRSAAHATSDAAREPNAQATGVASADGASGAGDGRARHGAEAGLFEAPKPVAGIGAGAPTLVGGAPTGESGARGWAEKSGPNSEKSAGSGATDVSDPPRTAGGQEIVGRPLAQVDASAEVRVRDAERAGVAALAQASGKPTSPSGAQPEAATQSQAAPQRAGSEVRGSVVARTGARFGARGLALGGVGLALAAVVVGMVVSSGGDSDGKQGEEGRTTPMPTHREETRSPGTSEAAESDGATARVAKEPPISQTTTPARVEATTGASEAGTVGREEAGASQGEAVEDSQVWPGHDEVARLRALVVEVGTVLSRRPAWRGDWAERFEAEAVGLEEDLKALEATLAARAARPTDTGPRAELKTLADGVRARGERMDEAVRAGVAHGTGLERDRRWESEAARQLWRAGADRLAGPGGLGELEAGMDRLAERVGMAERLQEESNQAGAGEIVLTREVVELEDAAWDARVAGVRDAIRGARERLALQEKQNAEVGAASEELARMLREGYRIDEEGASGTMGALAERIRAGRGDSEAGLVHVEELGRVGEIAGATLERAVAMGREEGSSVSRQRAAWERAFADTASIRTPGLARDVASLGQRLVAELRALEGERANASRAGIEAQRRQVWERLVGAGWTGSQEAGDTARGLVEDRAAWGIEELPEWVVANKSLADAKEQARGAGAAERARAWLERAKEWGSGSAWSGSIAELEGVLAVSQERADFSSAGPGSKGWSVEEGPEGRWVRYRSPEGVTPAVSLTFARHEWTDLDGAGRVTYLGTDEVSVGVLAGAWRSKELHELFKCEHVVSDRTRRWRVERGRFEALDGGSATTLALHGIGPGAASELAQTLGCDLPQVREWLAAAGANAPEEELGSAKLQSRDGAMRMDTESAGQGKAQPVSGDSDRITRLGGAGPNLAEYVRLDGLRFGAIGPSMLAPQRAVNSYAVVGLDRRCGYRDVGVRFSFDAPTGVAGADAAERAQRVEAILARWPFLSGPP